ncbi:unnamed protein product, partial [Ixodes persulcatus]
MVPLLLMSGARGLKRFPLGKETARFFGAQKLLSYLQNHNQRTDSHCWRADIRGNTAINPLCARTHVLPLRGARYQLMRLRTGKS